MNRNAEYKSVTVRVDEETLKKVLCLAEKEGISLSRQLVWMVKKALAGCEKDRG